MASKQFKVGDKVTSTYTFQTGTVSDKYEVLGLTSSELLAWQLNFILIEWDTGSISGELKRFINRI